MGQYTLNRRNFKQSKPTVSSESLTHIARFFPNKEMGNKQKKIAHAMQKEVAQFFLVEEVEGLSKLTTVSVMDVYITPDLRDATIALNILLFSPSNISHQSIDKESLTEAIDLIIPRLRHHLAHTLGLRHTPAIKFFLTFLTPSLSSTFTSTEEESLASQNMNTSISEDELASYAPLPLSANEDY